MIVGTRFAWNRLRLKSLICNKSSNPNQNSDEYSRLVETRLIDGHRCNMALIEGIRFVWKQEKSSVPKFLRTLLKKRSSINWTNKSTFRQFTNLRIMKIFWKCDRDRVNQIFVEWIGFRDWLLIMDPELFIATMYGKYNTRRTFVEWCLR